MNAFGIEQINGAVVESFPGSRVRCVEIGAGYAVAALEASADDLRPGDFISGPTQFALVDSAFWFGAFVALGRIELMALTSELSIRYLRPAQGATLFCRADVEVVTRRNVVLTGHVWVDDRRDKVTATAQGTYAIPLAK